MGKHLSREELLRHLDGELPASAMRKTTLHLQSCWTCQAELGRVEEQIALIYHAQAKIVGPLLPPPPTSWPCLEARLDRAQGERRTPFWKRLTHLRAPLAYAGATLSTIVIGWLVWAPVTTVSAKEALERATAADNARLAISDQQVVRQRLGLKKTERHGAREQAGVLEAWKSASSIFWKPGDAVTDSLRDRYAANGLEAALPLSPISVESWIRLAGSEPSTSRQGSQIRVRAAAYAVARRRGLEEVSFAIAPDWHIGKLTLSFYDATFEIVEEQSSILDQREVPDDVLIQLGLPDRKSGQSSAASPAIVAIHAPAAAVSK
jgi:hypothetical protein